MYFSQKYRQFISHKSKHIHVYTCIIFNFVIAADGVKCCMAALKSRPNFANESMSFKCCYIHFGPSGSITPIYLVLKNGYRLTNARGRERC